MIVFFSGPECPSSMRMLQRARVRAYMFSYEQFKKGARRKFVRKALRTGVKGKW